MAGSTSQPPRGAGAGRPAPAVRPGPWFTIGLAWLVPGAGHAVQGQPRKAVVFFVVLSAMFVIGVALDGRLFPFQTDDVLVMLATISQWLLAVPHAIASLAGYGPGQIRASGFEYGNTFLIVAGLLNALVMLDARDLSVARS